MLQLDLVHEVSELRLGQTIFLLDSEVWKTMVPLFIHLTYKWGRKKGTNFASCKENSIFRMVLNIKKKLEFERVYGNFLFHILKSNILLYKYFPSSD